MEPICNLLEKINQHREAIYDWLEGHEREKELPLYSSVDIRDAGFKVAAVDTNLFPAGFNNLCEHGIEDSVIEIQKAIRNRVPNCRNILIIAEEHTRNTWYLENLRILKDIIDKAGFNSLIATFLEVSPPVCQDAHCVELETATGFPLKIFSFTKIEKDLRNGFMMLDLIIMNNDLTKGIPQILKDLKVPIYPSINAGWHSRQKSHHFKYVAELINEFSPILGVDPWLFSCFDSVVDHVDINNADDRKRLQAEGEKLFSKIEAKYREHNIREKPFIFLKADSGTYGMGVMAFENPAQITDLNKYGRKKLHKGKNSILINRFLLQEGVLTRHEIGGQASEVCIYQIDNRLVGGFYRTHSDRTNRDNLNSQGMGFKKMCPHLNKYGHCGIPTEANIFDLYRILARISGIAAHREIVHLDEKVKK